MVLCPNGAQGDSPGQRPGFGASKKVFQNRNFCSEIEGELAVHVAQEELSRDPSGR